MKKIVKFMQNYLVISLPIVLIFFILSAFGDQENNLIQNAVIHHRVLWNVFSIGLVLWFVFLFLFLVNLVVFSPARETTLRRLANLKERDEREEYITGKAARLTYLSTLSIMLCCLFLSMLNISISEIPKEKSIDGNHHTLTVSLHYNFFNNTEKTIQEGNSIFDLKNVFPSTSTIILFFVCWQLLAFNLAARREQV